MYRSSPNRPRGRVRAFFVGAFALLSLFLSVSAWAQVVVDPVTIPGATAGNAYNSDYTASGGTAPYSFVILSGALPAGMDLHPEGHLIGTPRQTGFFNFTVQATDANLITGTRSYSLTVASPTIVLPATTLPDGTEGGSYFATLNVASGGNAPYTYSFYGGALPAGLFLNSNGTVTGTPSESGDFSFSVIATDSTSGLGPYYSAPRIYTLRVAAGPPPIASAVSATVAYGSTSNPILLSIIGSPATSVLIGTQAMSGTATATGTTISYTPNMGFAGPDSFTYIARNASGDSAPAAVNITVSSPNISVSASAPFTAQIGVPYAQTFTWNGGNLPYSSFQVLGLPAGLNVTGVGMNSVTVSGIPTATGNFSLTASATDSSTGTGPFTASQVFTLSVSAPTLTLAPAAGTLNATYGVAYSQQYTAGGGTPSYTYSISAGALPPGLSLNTGTGLLSGTPADTGSYNFSVRVRDNTTGTGAPFARIQNYVIVVASPTMTITPASLPAATAGAFYNQTLTTSGGIGSYSYTIFDGALPPGMTLSWTGVLSGSPTASGVYNFTVEARDANTIGTQMLYSLVVDPAAISLSTSGSLNGTAGVAQSATITASGGVGPYYYSLRSGALPVGISFNSTGLFTGTPRSDGNFSITVRATDQLGQFAEAIFTYSIAPATIVITPATLPGGTRGALYNESLSSTGGVAPYSYSLASGTLPIGMTFSSAGTLSGTPTIPGSYTGNIRSTDSAGYNVTQAYTIVISAPTITLTASDALDATVGQAKSVTFTASGGTGTYTYLLVSGSLPVGMNFSSTGQLWGTPLNAGTFNLTLRATDSYGDTAERFFSFVVAAPSIALTPNALGQGVRGSAYSMTLSASGGTAPYSYAVTAGSMPTGFTLNTAGVLSGTPTVDGSFNLTITATDAYGSTGSHAYTLTINAAPPTSADDVAQVLSGGSVSIDVTDNDSGVITSIAIASAPSHGTTTVSGLNVVYTPATDHSGTDSFTYIAAGPGGTSAPATVTVTVNPLPVAVSRTVTASAGLAMDVDLTDGATGGPFTAATLVSLTPAQAGTATIAQQGTGATARYVLTFTPVATFSGVATATFTLDNAFATSAEASIEFQVTARPDPTLDAEVQGLLSAQAQATRRFATAQLNNFQRRLESLHHGGSGFTNAVTFQANTPHCRDGMQGMQGLPNQLCDAQTSERDGANPGLRDASAVDAESGEPGNRPFGLWTGGAIRSGNQDSQNNRARVDFETDGLSVGGDYRVNDTFAIGLGLGWGRDDSEIGDQGSRSKGKAYTLAGYASYHPGKLFLDALFGYQDLSYDLRRYVAANGGYVSGSRDGGQWFASLSTGADLSFNTFNLTPYARLDLARATLDAYTEQGDALYALHYQDMDVDSSTGNLGLRMDFQHKTHWGSLRPQLRLEYQYDFQGNGSATMQYADLMSGPFYRTSLPVFDRSRFLLGIGLGVIGDHGLSTRIEYNGVVDDSNGTDHGVMINIEKRY